GAARGPLLEKGEGGCGDRLVVRCWSFPHRLLLDYVGLLRTRPGVRAPRSTGAGGVRWRTGALLGVRLRARDDAVDAGCAPHRRVRGMCVCVRVAAREHLHGLSMADAGLCLDARRGRLAACFDLRHLWALTGD